MSRSSDSSRLSCADCPSIALQLSDHIILTTIDMFDIIIILITFDVIDICEYVGGNPVKHSHADYVPAFKAMSDETRLKILDMLSCGEMCACEILEEFSISQSTLSYHMKMLSESGLVNAVRDGAWMRYTLNKERMDELKAFFACITSDKEDCICKTCKSIDAIVNIKVIHWPSKTDPLALV
jgi:ArsR family transcriptional regulator